MKKTLKFIGIIALTAIIGMVTLGCSKTGGTLVIANNTGNSIISSVLNEREFQELILLAGSIDFSNPSTEDSMLIASKIIPKIKTIENGRSASWDFEDDTNVVWLWAKGNLITADISTVVQGNETVEGGGTFTINAR